jgi:serine/threonine protein kinase
MARIYDPKEKIQGYTIEEMINTGNNSVSYAARTSSGDKVFFKLYQSPSVRVPWYKLFVQHQKELKARVEGGPCRQFCYRFLGGFEYERRYHQVFEFLDRSHSLAQILDKIRRDCTAVSWEQRELMAKVLVAGINQLHIARIIHADLKPDNIMLIEDPSIGMKYRLKIIDMDFSFFTDKKAPWDGQEGYFGTPGYMSPEHMTRMVPVPASDVFTLGMMLYQLLAQGHPYLFDEAEKYLPAYRAHSAQKPRLLGTPRPPAKAAAIEEVLYSCLHPDPEMRPSASDLHKALTGEAVTIGVGRSAGSPSSLTAGGSAVSTDTRAGDERESTKRREAEGIRKEIERLKGEARKKEEAEEKKREVPTRLLLVSSEGMEQSIGARVVFGRVVLAKFGEGAKYANDQQFILDRSGDEWFVEACMGTANDTMVNGELLAGGSRIPLASGDIIAIGKASRKKTVLELTVRKG